MTNNVENATAAQTAAVTFKNHNVVDGKVQPNKVWINVLRGESTSTIKSLQAEYDAKVEADAQEAAAEAAKAAKEAAANARTPVWKLILGTLTLYYPAKFVLGTVASLLSKCFALFSSPKKTEGV